MHLYLLKRWLRGTPLLKITALFLILTLMSAVALAGSQEPPPRQVRSGLSGERKQVNWISFDRARQEAAKTGKPIFIFFHFAGFSNYDAIFYQTFSDPYFVAVSREFACVEVPVRWARDGKGALAGMGSLARYNPKHKSLYGAFLDAEGKVFERKHLDCGNPNQFGGYNPPRYTRLLREILIQYSLKLGQKALQEKKFAIASNRFAVVLKYAREQEEKEQAETAIAGLHKIAATQLQKVKESMEAKKYLEAYETLASIKKDFHGLEPSKEAEKRIAQLEADPLIKNQIERARLDRKARPLYEKAVDYQEQGEHYLAYMTYKRITQSYANCPSGENAATRLKEIESDPSLMKIIKEKGQRREAKKLFDMAKNFEKNGLMDKALIYYQKIVDEFPDSLYFKEAKKKVRELKSY